MLLTDQCQPLVKENLETHGKKSGDSTKNIEILFFPLSNPFSIKGSQQPHSQGLLPFQNGGQTRKKKDKLLNTSKNHSSVQKTVSVQCFSFLVYHFMALASLVNISFLFNNLIYFISERFFPKTCEIGSLVVRP